MIITADIGGTKVDIAAFADSPDCPVGEPVQYDKFFTKDYSDFEALLAAFIAATHITPSAIVIGIAGPVLSDTVTLTNLKWTLDRNKIARHFKCDRVAFLNDMEAHAYGALTLDETGIKTLNKGESRTGNRAIIAAGTGLGEAFMVWDGERHRVYPCEGGHTSFAPQSATESDLLKFAQQRHHHVSAERLISGSLGFPLMREFYQTSGRLDAMDPSARERLLQAEEIGPVLTELANAGEPVAVEMMTMFVEMYGAEASNLVLKVNGIGGIYIGGGIARQNISWFQNGAFRAAFGNKGRFRKLMESTAIWLIDDHHNALKGLASYARACS